MRSCPVGHVLRRGHHPLLTEEEHPAPGAGRCPFASRDHVHHPDLAARRSTRSTRTHGNQTTMSYRHTRSLPFLLDCEVRELQTSEGR